MPTKNDKTSVRESVNIVYPFLERTFIPRNVIKTEKPKKAKVVKPVENQRVADRIKLSTKRANKMRDEEANKYTIPYIKDKEIRLTTDRYNTGRISTNVLDSIYDSAIRVGLDPKIALGLAGRESTLGIGRGFKRGQSISGTDLMSNWQQITPYLIPNDIINGFNSIYEKYNDNTPMTKEEADKMIEFFDENDKSVASFRRMKEHPIDNALKFYMAGKYNPGDKKHTQMVEEDARILMTDPAIQRWYKEKTNEQMKCGGRRKAQLGLDIREGGIAIPINKNMYYMQGRSHDEGGIGIGPNNKNGLEVEGGEVVKVDNNSIKVFSSVPLLRGVSPAQLVMGGANPNKVFKAQEDFKDRNNINDDGTTYQIGGEKNNKYPLRALTEDESRPLGGYPTISGVRTYKYLRGLVKGTKAINKGTNLFRAGRYKLKGTVNSAIKSGKLNPQLGQAIKSAYNKFIGSTGQELPKTINLIFGDNKTEKKAGGIYIKPSKRGTFTAAAKKRGMGVQEFANKVLANKEDYSPAMVKKANFARNASRWKKKFGGNMIYTINGNVKNGLMSIRPKAELGKEKKINSTTKIGADGLIYTWGPDGEWYTDGTRYEDSKYYMREKSVLSGSKRSDGSIVRPKQKTQSLDEFVVTAPRINRQEVVKPNVSVETNTQTTSNTSPQFYAEKRMPMFGEKSVAEKMGIARSGWSYGSAPTISGANENVLAWDYPAINYRKLNRKQKEEISKIPNSQAVKQEVPTNEKPYTANVPSMYDIATQVYGKYIAPKVTDGTINLNAVPEQTKTSKTKTSENKDERLIGQYKKLTTEDWIGLGSNVIGSLANYFINKNTINKMPMPSRPVSTPAAKLKTRFNINAPLSELREAEQLQRNIISRNTQSSNVSRAAQQRAINEAQRGRNQLYTQKENVETQLINQDRLNRQSITARNIAAYNDWMNRLTNAKINQSQLRSANVTNLISGLTGGVTDILGRIENRRATNNALRAYAAANPNVDARIIGGFDYYRDAQGRKYDKNGRLIG